MVFLYSFIIAVLLLLAYMYLETGWLKVERVDLSRGGDGLKILQLSDLHVYMLAVGSERVRKVIKAENPDVIILTGDYINEPVHASGFLEYLHSATRGYRTLLCLGNHDFRAFKGNPRGLANFIKEIEALQVEVLHNRSVVIEKGTAKYNFIGIEDLREGSPDIEKALEGTLPDIPKIAFTHNPDLALHIPGKIVDCLLCGHFHGGQIWMPWNLEFFLLRKDELCRMGLRRGLHRINDIKVYMNRGLGNVVVPLRFLSRPEITVINIG
jgi:predicted MPP superfamily phosphohydrolase